MKKISSGRMRLSPWCMSGILFVLVVVMLVLTSFGLRAEYHEYTIHGREFRQDSIIYDIPQAGDPSRIAEVVRFSPRTDGGFRDIAIPPYIDVDGVRYTVAYVRKGSATETCKNGKYTLTLSPTLKNCDWTWDQPSEFDEKNRNPPYYLMAVRNVNVTDLDSFLLMDHFQQTFNRDPHAYKPPTSLYLNYSKWSLYLNGTEVQSIVLPEGADLNRVKLFNCRSIRSLTIPASDTIRNKPVDWGESAAITVNTIFGVDYINILDTLKFKEGASGYDLWKYTIATRNIVLPADLREFNGFGGSFTLGGGANVTKWPEKLQTLSATAGVQTPLISEIPSTVTTVGNNSDKRCELNIGDSNIIVPKNWNVIRQCTIKLSGVSRTFVIENSTEPLLIKAGGPIFKSEDRLSEVIIHRNIRYRINETKLFDRTIVIGTMVFGTDVTEIPGGIFNLGDCRIKLIFQGNTPPECVNWPAIPKDMFSAATLYVPKEAIDAYRDHPVWGRFTIRTSDVYQLQTGKEVVREQWYGLDGRLLPAPRPGEMGICVTTYSDGTTTHRKMVVPGPSVK